MKKKIAHTVHKHTHHISPWVFLAIAVISGVTCVFALRNNNLTAVKLRNQVNQVDKVNGDVEGALRTLREYVYNHMNTNLAAGPDAIKPPIQLKYRYERLLQAADAKVNQQDSTIYTDAQTICQKEFPVGLSGRYRLPCIKAYVTSHSISAPTIPASLYEFDFLSPFWSPDLAGWSMVVAAVAFLLFVLRFGLERWVRADLRDL